MYVDLFSDMTVLLLLLLLLFRIGVLTDCVTGSGYGTGSGSDCSDVQQLCRVSKSLGFQLNPQVNKRLEEQKKTEYVPLLRFFFLII